MSLLVMNASQLCLCKYESQNYKMTCIIKKKTSTKNKHGRQEWVGSARFPGHTLLI